MEIGLLVLRLVIGLTMVGHGTQKLFGWFGGHGLSATGDAFHGLGYRPGKAFALAAGLTEATGGLMLALGLVTPLAGAAMIGTLFNAVLAVHLRNGFWAQNQGFEYPVALMGVGAAVAFTGAGTYSLDHAFGWTLQGGGWGTFGVVLGVVSGLAVDLYRRRTLGGDRQSPAGHRPLQSTA
jgi:putative oxidoreductase